MVGLSKLIWQWSTLPTFLVLVASAVLVSWQCASLMSKIGEVTSLPILDVRTTGYSASEAYDLFNKLGSKGRSMYLWLNTIDFAVPIVIGPLLAVMSGPVLKKGGLWMQLNVGPLIYSFFDISENIALRYLLNNYPAQSPRIVSLASKLTQLKFIANIPAFAPVLLGLLALIPALFQARNAKSSGGQQRKVQ